MDKKKDVNKIDITVCPEFKTWEEIHITVDIPRACTELTGKTWEEIKNSWDQCNLFDMITATETVTYPETYPQDIEFSTETNLL